MGKSGPFIIFFYCFLWIRRNGAVIPAHSMFDCSLSFIGFFIYIYVMLSVRYSCLLFPATYKVQLPTFDTQNNIHKLKGTIKIHDSLEQIKKIKSCPFSLILYHYSFFPLIWGYDYEPWRMIDFLDSKLKNRPFRQGEKNLKINIASKHN